MVKDSNFSNDFISTPTPLRPSSIEEEHGDDEDEEDDSFWKFRSLARGIDRKRHFNFVPPSANGKQRMRLHRSRNETESIASSATMNYTGRDYRVNVSGRMAAILSHRRTSASFMLESTKRTTMSKRIENQ
ncbi:hypothetical protein V1477_009576 [Vespula maculifrons]|uniref:Uncharacterized protein n=1 Tax=Vespula maculifrons TaxID=7453 RepID=A0ABD2CA96_VESMC